MNTSTVERKNVDTYHDVGYIYGGEIANRLIEAREEMEETVEYWTQAVADIFNGGKPIAEINIENEETINNLDFPEIVHTFISLNNSLRLQIGNDGSSIFVNLVESTPLPLEEDGIERRKTKRVASGDSNVMATLREMEKHNGRIPILQKVKNLF